MKKHIKKFITIYGLVYSLVTGVIFFILIKLIKLIKEINITLIILTATFAQNLISKGKEKLDEYDKESKIWKHKEEIKNLKKKLDEKESVLIAFRAELVNHITKPDKDQKDKAEKLIKRLANWSSEAKAMNQIDCTNEREIKKQREQLKGYLNF